MEKMEKVEGIDINPNATRITDMEKVEKQLKVIYEVIKEEYKNDQIHGYDFNQGVNYDKLFESYKYVGFQSSEVAQGIDQINKMIFWKATEDETLKEEFEGLKDLPEELEKLKNTRCTIFLGYTSNMVSSGTREIIRYLAQHKMIDAIVTTAGGIEEDFIKCICPFYLGGFNVNDVEMRKRSLNRIGNIFVPSENYCQFEKWLEPIIEYIYDQQKNHGKIWSPSTLIKLLGEKINNESSIYYWCAKNDIPVFCPAITDGAIGDMIFYNTFKYEGLILDIVQDIVTINKMALNAKKSGVITLGGGLIKHHILNANIWKNGADFGVFINTAVDYDGSDSGAKPTEAITWGKLKINSNTVKIFSEASVIFPIIVANTFAKHFETACRVKEQ